jgi:S-adenosylmethionine:tRNA ribosyltransferase-isomerase
VKTSDFDYDLPPGLIAQTPTEPRDASRLLVVDRASGVITHRTFGDIGEYLRLGDLLVANDSRVIPARLRASKPSGGAVEILLLRTTTEDPDVWECLVGGKGMRPGVQARVAAPGHPGVTATVLDEAASGGRLIRFDPPVASWLWDAGEMPLPPYIHAPLADPERYQTVYGRIEGSAASSTAGLHFTPELLLKLRGQGIGLAYATLHIGLDTFRPVEEEEIEAHRIHREWMSLSPDAARAVNETRLGGGRVIAVGTTAVRALESAAQAALGCVPGEAAPPGAACGWRTVGAFTGETGLYITPGHAFRAVDALVTNFHLPRSTLLMLVSAFAGKELVDRAYAEAIAERYRFYSFGDAMLIL